MENTIQKHHNGKGWCGWIWFELIMLVFEDSGFLRYDGMSICKQLGDFGYESADGRV
jgi:hypothetical protein